MLHAHQLIRNFILKKLLILANKRLSLNKEALEVPFRQLVLKNDALNLSYPPVRTSLYEHYYRRWMRLFSVSGQLLLIDGKGEAEISQKLYCRYDYIKSFFSKIFLSVLI